MPPTSKDQHRIRALQQIKLTLKAFSEDAAAVDDMQLAWWLDQAANNVCSAELRLISRSTISISTSPASLDSRREPSRLPAVSGSKEDA